MALPTTAAGHLQFQCRELYALGEGVYGYWIDTAEAEINPTTGINGWSGSTRPLAVALLAAHLWARNPATIAAAGHLQFQCRELYALGEGVYGYWIDTAEAEINPTTGINGWSGSTRPLAVALLAAHLWARNPATIAAAEATGIVSAESATNPLTQKGLSRSYSVPAAASPEEASLLTTRWGQAFVDLRRRQPAFGPRTVALSIR